MIFFKRLAGSDANERAKGEINESLTSRARCVSISYSFCVSSRVTTSQYARSFVVFVKVINFQHELYTLSIAVMLGVRTSIGTTNAKMSAADGRHWLTSDDFMAAEKYEFSPKVRTPRDIANSWLAQ
jgi:hypothetical protein